MRTWRGVAIGSAIWLGACAGELVVRAPLEQAPAAESALAAIAPLAVGVGSAAGAPTGLVGTRAAGWGFRQAPIELTEPPATVLRRVVVDELRAAGHRVTPERPDVWVALRVDVFSLEAPRRGLGWDVVAKLRLALRVERRPDAAEHVEFVYTAERSRRTFLAPSVGSTERVLAECLEDLAQLVSQREALASALQRFGRGAS